jgi:hypothetical protein
MYTLTQGRTPNRNLPHSVYGYGQRGNALRIPANHRMGEQKKSNLIDPTYPDLRDTLTPPHGAGPDSCCFGHGELAFCDTYRWQT